PATSGWWTPGAEWPTYVTDILRGESAGSGNDETLVALRQVEPLSL
ncbi:MAG: hypothetical protein JWR46_2710, partial [Mycobacterium sp.]|nr:hypothetical protein [Mycobacterium sp.]